MKKIFGACFLVLSLVFSVPAMARITLMNTFVGVKGKVLKNIEGRLKIRQKIVAKKLRVEDIYSLYKKAPLEIQKAVQPFGYFRAKIKSSFTHKGDNWAANYVIDLGSPLKVTTIRIDVLGEAVNDPKFQKLKKRLLARKGKVFTSKWYEKAKDAFFNLAHVRGYLTARTTKSVVKISLKRYTCEVILCFESGPRYYFGQPLFFKPPFDEDFLKKFLTFKPGQYYSSRKIEEVRAGFDNSGLFQSALVEPWLKKAKKKRVPVVFHLKPRKSQQYTFGAGYGTDTGARGLIGLGFYNLTKTGHHFYATFKVAQKLAKKVSKNSPRDQGSFEAHYIIPGPKPATDRFDINAATIYEDDDKGIKAGASFVTLLYGWKQTIQLNLQQDWFTPQHRDWRKTNSLLLIPGVTWLKSKGNNPIRPTRGYRVEFGIWGAPLIKPISTVPFFQTEIRGKTILQLAGRKTLLVLRGDLGKTWVKSNNSLPESLLFAAGGSQSIRGYDYETFVDGTHLAVASAELRQQVHGYWYGDIFYDIGMASNSFLRAKYHQGVGVGVVWLSPVGAIALSYTVPIHKPGTIGKIQFSMGPEL